MSNILDTIVAAKKAEVKLKEQTVPRSSLEQQAMFNRQGISLKEALNDKASSGIIAEFKRRSPSRGDINTNADAAGTTSGYVSSGAAALSVLTDEMFFGAKPGDFSQARAGNLCPILRKDFIISEYQVAESKAMGADVLLLIAAILTPERAMALAAFAKETGLEVLLEIHSSEELDRISDYIDIVGVNNRNLQDFSVSVNNSVLLYDQIPSSFTKISESGIDQPDVVVELKKIGFNGFLIGEKFMSTPHPQKACSDFINEIKNREQIKSVNTVI